MCGCAKVEARLPGLKASASVIARNRLRNEQVPKFRSMLLGPMRDEIRLVKQVLATGLAALDDWLEDFYPEHESVIQRVAEPVVRSYGAAVVKVALQEIGEVDTPVPAELFARQYAETMAAKWINSSQAQLRQIIRDEIEPEEAILGRLEKWALTRHVWNSEKDATQAGGAFSKLSYLAARIERLVWRTVSPCDLCAPLEGKVVGITSAFVDEGGTVQPRNGANPITVSQSIGHPPLHGLDGRGGVCQCQIAAAV